jgi:hypothetical protein
MDQLMIGYGVNNNNNGPNPPAGYNSDLIVSGDNSNTNRQNQPKKELTLSEKHELATKLENEFSLDAYDVKNTSFTSSMSLNNIKPASINNNKNTKNLTDNLMDRNLADLNFNTSNNKASSILPNSQSTNFSIQNTTQNRFQAPNNFSQNNMFGNMNNQSFQQQRPSFQQQNMTNQQMGFFGNLALPAPGDSNVIKNNNFPTIAPPPSYNNLKPATNLNTFGNKTSPPSQNNTKKSALDDLADIFG